MPVTSLNKLIAIIIVGLIPLPWVFFRFFYQAGADMLTSAPINSLLGAAAFTVVVVSIAITIGVVTDSIADIFFHPFARFIVKEDWAGRLATSIFLKNDIREGYLRWENYFWTVLGNSPYQRIKGEDSSNPLGESKRRVAAGIFLREATNQNFEWLSYHYSIYILARNLASSLLVILIVGEVYWFDLRDWRVIFLVLITIYFLIGLAIDSYLYSYIITFRFAVLACINPITAVTANARQPIVPLSNATPPP